MFFLARFLVPLLFLLLPFQVMAEEAVLVHFSVSNSGMGSAEDLKSIFILEDKLKSAIDSAGVGEFDGNEIGGGQCILYMYGPSAEKIFEIVKPILDSSSLAKGGYARVRFGPPGSPEKKYPIGSKS